MQVVVLERRSVARLCSVEDISGRQVSSDEGSLTRQAVVTWGGFCSVDIIGGRKCCSLIGSLDRWGCSTSLVRMLVIWSRAFFLPKAEGEGVWKPLLSQLLAFDGFLSKSKASNSIAVQVVFSFLSETALDTLDPVGLIMGELLSKLTADLVGVLTNSSLVTEIALPEERPMSLLAGLLPGVGLELQWVVRGEGTEGRLWGDGNDSFSD